jgi:hypothetical protein
MTEFWTIEDAFFVMVLMIVIGVILALGVMPQVDYIINELRGMGFDAGAGTKWDTTREFWVTHQLFVLLCYTPAPLGVIIFLVACTKRARRDSYAESGQIYYGPEY